MIHCIGDSHVSIFSGKDGMQPTYPNQRDIKGKYDRCNIIEGITQYRLGPYTAYNFMNKPSIDQTVVNNVNASTDVVFFSAGEIDCRAHIRYQAIEQNRSIEDLTIECVERYINYIKTFKSNNYNVGVIGPHVFMEAPDDVLETTIIFNDELIKRCEELNMHYVSAFKYVVNNMNLNNYLQNDGVHLSITVLPEFIRQFKELGLL